MHFAFRAQALVCIAFACRHSGCDSSASAECGGAIFGHAFEVGVFENDTADGEGLIDSDASAPSMVSYEPLLRILGGHLVHLVLPCLHLLCQLRLLELNVLPPVLQAAFFCVLGLCSWAVFLGCIRELCSWAVFVGCFLGYFLGGWERRQKA